jgi:hypothetical protein
VLPIILEEESGKPDTRLDRYGVASLLGIKLNVELDASACTRYHAASALIK